MTLHTLTITEAHKKLKAGETTSTALVEACLKQIDVIDGTLNAVVYKNTEAALLKAKQADERGDFSAPLAGIPFLTKDVFCEAGVPTTACSNMLRGSDYVPPFDATTIKRLNDQGAISLGKTNTDEFTMGASTETSCYGVTKNPWDTTRVPGGSSGGSAAAVAADECIFALGTDTGGSIRQPAGFCGITGMRNTYGRCSRYGVMSMASSLDTVGAFTKTVEDYAAVLQALAGQDERDPTTADQAVPDYSKALTGDVKGLKIGLPKEYFIDGIDQSVEQAVRDAAKQYESMGAEIVDVSLPHTEYGVATYYIICPSEVSSNMARYDGVRYGHTVNDAEDLVDYYFRARSSGFGPEVKRRIMLGTYVLSAGYFDAYYRKAQKVRALLKQDFDRAFEKVDLIMSPVSPSAAFTIGAHANDPVAMYLEDVFTVTQAMAGIPCLSIPCGFSPEKLPIGLQLMAPQWAEASLLKAGYAYQQQTDWHARKPLSAELKHLPS